MSVIRLGAADPRLADAGWMARTYAEHGDMWIALEVGAARKTVRARRERLGIPSQPVGRRHGVPLDTAAPGVPHPADVRYERERKARGPAPTEMLLTAQIHGLLDAKLAGDHDAYDDALLGLSSAAKLIYDHHRKLRGSPCR